MKKITLQFIVILLLLMVTSCKNDHNIEVNKINTQETIYKNDTSTLIKNDLQPATAVINIFKAKEYETQIIKKDSLSNLFVDVIIQNNIGGGLDDVEEKVLSSAFEFYAYLPRIRDDKRDSIFWNKNDQLNKKDGLNSSNQIYHQSFIISDTMSIKDSNLMLVSFYNPMGWELIQYFFALFEKNDRELLLQGIIPKLFCMSFSGLEIKRLTKLSTQEFMMEIKIEGGDDSHYEALSLCYLKLPTVLKEVYHDSFDIDMESPFTDSLKTVFDEATSIYRILRLKREVTSNKSYCEWTYGNWTIIKTDTIRCNDYLEN